MSAVAKQVEVKERPIIFGPESINSILSGIKTQTRRVISPPPIVEISRRERANRTWHVEIEWKGVRRRSHGYAGLEDGDKVMLESWAEDFCPYGKPGDQLWCREAFAHLADLKTKDPGTAALMSRAFFRADHPTGLSHDDATDLKWRSPLFLPRYLSRITLEITNIRVERVQEISAADAKAEGVEPFLNRDATAWRAGFQIGWNEINAKRGYSWEFNPWVWVIEFRKL